MNSSEYKKILNELTVAYKKLKSYVYYDNTLIDLRVKIANYESVGVRRKLNELARTVLAYKNGDTSGIDNQLEKISFISRPKRISSQKATSKYSFVLTCPT